MTSEAGGLWRRPDFLRLWGAQIASAFGSRITRTALILTIPAAAWLGALSMPQLYVVAAGVGVATSLFQIADNTYLPSLVPPGLLLEANAKLESTEAVAEAAGPGIAGVLIQALTAPVAVIIDGASYLWSALLLYGIRAREEPAPVSAVRPTVWGDVTTGFHAALAHPRVGPALLAEAVITFFGGVFLALYMVMGLETLRLSPAALGLIIGVGGVGAFAGALMAGPLARRLGTGRAMAVSLGVGASANLLIALAAGGGTLAVPLLIIQQLIGDAFLSAYVIHSVSLRQRELPREVLGRANAAFHAVGGLMLPAGALLAGALADAIGIPLTLWIGACGGLLAVPVLLAAPVLKTR